MTGTMVEAASGYITVRMATLPIFDRLRLDGVGEGAALLQVLLYLIAANDDANLGSRGGLAALDQVRAYARRLLPDDVALAPDGAKKMAAIDDVLVAHHVSPGGTAILLGVTWFLAQFPTADEGADRSGSPDFRNMASSRS
jgi:triphosphoribosyl-dephospho-CoA synthase